MGSARWRVLDVLPKERSSVGVSFVSIALIEQAVNRSRDIWVHGAIEE